jgi:hypothetical protein
MNTFSTLVALLGMLLWFVIPLGGGYLLLRFVRAFERRSATPTGLAALEERIRLLEDANTRMEAELVQVTDAQRFTTELLAERSTVGSE